MARLPEASVFLVQIEGILELIQAKGDDPMLNDAANRLRAMRDRLKTVDNQAVSVSLEDEFTALLLANPRLDRANSAWLSGVIVKNLELAITRFSDLGKGRQLSPEELARLRKAEGDLPVYRQMHAKDISSI
jgi:hypothetical protein